MSCRANQNQHPVVPTRATGGQSKVEVQNHGDDGADGQAGAVQSEQVQGCEGQRRIQATIV